MQPRSMPFALPEFFLDRLHKEVDSKGEIWFIFQGSKLLVCEDSMEPLPAGNLPLVRSVYMGMFKKDHVHAAEMAVSAESPSGAIWVDLRTLYGKMNEALYALAGRAIQLISWDRTHQFCGECGNKTTNRAKERAKECLSCNLLAFPKICPAIMALVCKGDDILLARGPHFAKGEYSVLAGFVDPGETLEQCVQREVFEEVGLKIDDIKYFGSQSWPFPHSLMVAFTCRWVSGEIVPDPAEIEDAQWFSKENLPFLPPKVSISRALIDATLN